MSSTFHYDRVQRAFHWSMAAIIFTAIALGLWASYLDRSNPLKSSLLFVHKSFGLTVLVLVIARVTYRLIVGKPPYQQPLHRFNQVGSTAAHLLLYGLMILMPVSGYVFTGAGGHPLPFLAYLIGPTSCQRIRRYLNSLALFTIGALGPSAACWPCTCWRWRGTSGSRRMRSLPGCFPPNLAEPRRERADNGFRP